MKGQAYYILDGVMRHIDEALRFYRPRLDPIPKGKNVSVLIESNDFRRILLAGDFQILAKKAILRFE